MGSSEKEKANNIFDRNLLDYKCGYHDVCVIHNCAECNIDKERFDYDTWESMRSEVEEKRFGNFLSMED